MKLILNESLKKYLSKKSNNLFCAAMSIDGVVYRKLAARETLKFKVDDQAYFIKKHFGVGLKEIIKELSQGKLPVLGAKLEWQAIRRLNRMGVQTAEVVGFGSKGINPAKQNSFVILRELPNTKSVNDVLIGWQDKKPDFALRMWLLDRIAHIVSTMHQHHFIHRDCYMVHFHLDRSIEAHVPKDLNLPIYVIDLHRSFVKRFFSKRWVIKDLASLYFSVKDVYAMTDRDAYRFIKWYAGKPLRESLVHDANFWRAVRRKGERLLKTASRL